MELPTDSQRVTKNPLYFGETPKSINQNHRSDRQPNSPPQPPTRYVIASIPGNFYEASEFIEREIRRRLRTGEFLPSREGLNSSHQR